MTDLLLLGVSAVVGGLTGPWSRDLDANPFAYCLSALIGARVLLRVLS